MVAVAVGREARGVDHVADAAGFTTGTPWIAVNPNSADVYVLNFEAMNLTRFEPNLGGRFGQYRVTRVDPGTGTVSPVHLNPHINYGVSPGPPAEVALSLSQPNGAAWDAAGANLYVAVLGSGKRAVVDAAGAVTARVDVGEGPTAVAVDDARDRAYVLNRFTNTLARAVLFFGMASTAAAAEMQNAPLVLTVYSDYV